MIPFIFSYYRPDTIKEATDIYSKLQSEGKAVVYFAGGSEIITLCRTSSIQPDAVIDIKNIPECMSLSFDGDKLNIGSVCTLNQIKESKLFPLLGLACGRIADHTNQCKITLGGNICGTIIYRETSLPLLISDADITLCCNDGERTVPFQEIFNKRIVLKPGEIVIQVHIPEWALHARYFHIKETANEKIDYPLVSIAAIQKDDKLRFAFSGVCSYPFRSEKIESILNDKTLSYEERANISVESLPEEAHNYVEGSNNYRIFVFKNTLQNILKEWENG